MSGSNADELDGTGEGSCHASHRTREMGRDCCSDAVRKHRVWTAALCPSRAAAKARTDSCVWGVGVNQSDAFRFVSVIAAGNRSAPGRFRPLAASNQVVQFVCLSKLPAALLKAPYWAKLALPLFLLSWHWENSVLHSLCLLHFLFFRTCGSWKKPSVMSQMAHMSNWCLSLVNNNTSTSLGRILFVPFLKKKWKKDFRGQRFKNVENCQVHEAFVFVFCWNLGWKTWKWL